MNQRDRLQTLAQELMLDALVLDPELQGRLNFKQIAREVGLYDTVHSASTLREGIERLNGVKEYGVMFISTRFAESVIGEFVPAAKRSPCGRDAACLLMVRGGETDNDTLARAMAAGADGILVEPYSIESLKESTELALRVRAQRVEARLRSAVSMMVQSATSYVDEMWKAYRSNENPNPALRKLAAIKEDVQRLPSAYQALFHEELAERTGRAAPPPPVRPLPTYSGKSQRVKARLLKKRA